jgi:lactoylglutathione lyase
MTKMTNHSHHPVRVHGLFETHLTVSDLQRSIDFYRDIVGLDLVLEKSERNAAFFWIGNSRSSMLGLWSTGSAPLGLTLPIAFQVDLEDLLAAPNRLKAYGIIPLSFFGVETMEPSVIAWMPAAAIYFRDPDGHLLEYLTMLDTGPNAELGIIPWSEWVVQTSNSPRKKEKIDSKAQGDSLVR